MFMLLSKNNIRRKSFLLYRSCMQMYKLNNYYVKVNYFLQFSCVCKGFIVFNNKKSNEIKVPEYPNIIEQADKLFEEGKFMEVYDLLNTSKFYTNAEILWRISRTLYKLSLDVSLTKDIQKEVINEAFKVICIALSHEKHNANVHKWMAIILDARNGFESTLARVKNSLSVKEHLLLALELSPNDTTLLYMLGHWCFSMCSLNWFQRKVATFLFGDIPTSTYEEAYKYFLKVEELRPRYFLPNTYMLGKVSYHLNQYFRARYYLNEVATLTPCNEYEKKCILDAKIIAAELEFFDLARDAIFNAFF